jgi:hypothetical protein
MEVLGEWEGPGGGRASVEGRARIAPTQQAYYNVLVQFINDYFKWFGLCGISMVPGVRESRQPVGAQLGAAVLLRSGA